MKRAGLVSVTTLALLAAGCGGGSAPSAQFSRSPISPPTSAAATPSGPTATTNPSKAGSHKSTPATTAATSTSLKPAGKPSTSTSSSATATTAAGATPLTATVPPPVGTYQFSESTDGGSAQNVKVNVASFGAPGGTGRTVATSTSQGSEAEQDVWSSGKVVITASTLSSGSQSAKCDWSPAIQTLGLPLAKGESTSASGTCTIKEDGFILHVKRTIDSRVIGTAVVTIGGTRVTTWAETRTDDLTLTGTGLSSTIDTTTTADYDPSLGMAIKTDSVAKTQATYAGKSQKSTHRITTIAKSLQPS